MMMTQSIPLTHERAALIEALKRAAKAGKKNHPSKRLAWFLDQIAIALGYLNWALLHKHVATISNAKFDKLKGDMLTHPKIGALLEPSLDAFDEDAAGEEMRDWVRQHYTPLLDFAFYDSESSNGFAWPDVDLREELQDKFGGQFPDDLISAVAAKLEEAGPWGVEMDPGDAAA
jgi:hypothetical protein